MKSKYFYLKSKVKGLWLLRFIPSVSFMQG
jgi:hypothetical protein